MAAFVGAIPQHVPGGARLAMFGAIAATGRAGAPTQRRPGSFVLQFPGIVSSFSHCAA